MKALSIAMLMLGIAGCAKSVEPLALSITAQATPTSAAPGDSITVVTNVQGDGLVGVAVDFGDNTVFTYEFSGARRGKVTYKHPYATTGTFTITATVFDAAEDQRSTTMTVSID